MKNLLWIGDAACGSGFGRATHHILPYAQEQFNVSAIGVNYKGDPHKEPFDIYPAWAGGDQLGMRRLKELVPKLEPDLIAIQSNPWNIPHYLQALKDACAGAPMPPVVGIIAVEGKNCRGTQLNQLARAIFWNEFSKQEAIKGGMKIPASVVPLGVDLDTFSPGDKHEARAFLGLPIPRDSFIVTNVNRNQTRKRLDLSVKYFAEWIQTRKVDNAYLYLHVLPGSTIKCELDQLAGYYGVQGRLILAEPRDVFNGAPTEYVVATYRACDVQINTGLGEGWGLTSMEGMACHKANIVGDYAAFGEWAKDAALLVPCSEEGIMPDVQNMIGAAPDRQPFIEALDMLYRFPDVRERYAQAGFDRVSEAQYRWDTIGRAFANEICREG